MVRVRSAYAASDEARARRLITREEYVALLDTALGTLSRRHDGQSDRAARADELATLMADPEARERFRHETRSQALRRMTHMTEEQLDAQWELPLQRFG